MSLLCLTKHLFWWERARSARGRRALVHPNTCCTSTAEQWGCTGAAQRAAQRGVGLHHPLTAQQGCAGPEHLEEVFLTQVHPPEDCQKNSKQSLVQTSCPSPGMNCCSSQKLKSSICDFSHQFPRFKDEMDEPQLEMLPASAKWRTALSSSCSCQDRGAATERHCGSWRETALLLLVAQLSAM